jgi:hypothetical protein
MDPECYSIRKYESRTQFVEHESVVTDESDTRSLHRVLRPDFLLSSSLGEYFLFSGPSTFYSACPQTLSHNVYIVVVVISLFIFALTAASVAACLVYIHPSTTLNAFLDLLRHKHINCKPFECVSTDLR